LFRRSKSYGARNIDLDVVAVFAIVTLYRFIADKTGRFRALRLARFSSFTFLSDILADNF